ncbi:hypothetical protein H8959_015824, partial [Pygathrix nigripes]
MRERTGDTPTPSGHGSSPEVNKWRRRAVSNVLIDCDWLSVKWRLEPRITKRQLIQNQSYKQPRKVQNIGHLLQLCPTPGRTQDLGVPPLVLCWAAESMTVKYYYLTFWTQPRQFLNFLKVVEKKELQCLWMKELVPSAHCLVFGTTVDHLKQAQ